MAGVAFWQPSSAYPHHKYLGWPAAFPLFPSAAAWPVALASAILLPAYFIHGSQLAKPVSSVNQKRKWLAGYLRKCEKKLWLLIQLHT